MANTQPTDGSGFKQDLHELGQGVDSLKADVKNLAYGTADAARSGAAELRQGAQRAVDTAKDKLDGVKESAADAVHSLKDVIARNPMASVGIAAGVGMLFGMVLCRSRS